MCIFLFLKKKKYISLLFSSLKFILGHILIVGELDPERIGSGIQYGDASLRRLTRHQQRQSRSLDCSC